MTIPHEDRRWFVVEGRETKREDAFYAAADAWLKAPETGNLIRGFLQLRWESMGAARRAAISGIAPETETKRQMIDAGMTPVMTAIKELLTGDACSDLIALKDVLDHLHNLKMNDRLARNAPLPNPTVLGIWMRTKFRVPAVPVGKDGKPYPALLPDKTLVRLYAVRRAATYAPLTARVVGRLYAEQIEKGRARLFTAAVKY